MLTFEAEQRDASAERDFSQCAGESIQQGEMPRSDAARPGHGHRAPCLLSCRNFPKQLACGVEEDVQGRTCFRGCMQSSLRVQDAAQEKSALGSPLATTEPVA